MARQARQGLTPGGTRSRASGSGRPQKSPRRPGSRRTRSRPSGDKVYRHPTFYASRRHTSHVGVKVTDDRFAAYKSLTRRRETTGGVGTGFTDPLEGIRVVPDGVETADADRLRPGARRRRDDLLAPLQQWMTRCRARGGDRRWPKIALECGAGADCCWPRPGRPRAAAAARMTLAFFRDEPEFRSVRAEHTDADFAELAGRLLVSRPGGWPFRRLAA